MRFNFYPNATYKKAVEVDAKKNLQKNLSRTPSKSEIVQMVNDYINGRDFVFGLISLVILATAVFKKVIIP